MEAQGKINQEVQTEDLLLIIVVEEEKGEDSWEDAIENLEEDDYHLDIELPQHPELPTEREDPLTKVLIELQMPMNQKGRDLNLHLIFPPSYWNKCKRRYHHHRAQEGTPREPTATQA